MNMPPAAIPDGWRRGGGRPGQRAGAELEIE
jgi:hypothetical protein